MLPPNQVHIAEQHLDLAPDQQRFKRRVVDVHVGNVDLLDVGVAVLDVGQHGFHVLELPLNRQRKGRHGAFHALEHIHPQQVDQALFTVGLAEEALAAANLGAVLGIVGGLLVR